MGFGPENLGVPSLEIWDRVQESLQAVEMHGIPAPFALTRLSGGQKQRVAIAGVVAMHPKCIVLDEPTAMLDPNGRKEVIRTVQGAERGGRGDRSSSSPIIWKKWCGRIRSVVMDDGKIVMQGTPREIFLPGR